jgi:hypothetical protein
MSLQLTSRSADLLRLRNEGYDVEVRGGYLVMSDVPYLTADRTIARGTIVSTLTLAGDVTTTPDTHVAMFAGADPCDVSGQPLDAIINARGEQQLLPDLTIQLTFSSKPPDGYPDYFEKMTAYANMISAPAQAIDPDVTARTYPVIEDTEQSTVFRYVDTATPRAGIGIASGRLAAHRRIGIVGLGGTGAQVTDLVTKTPVEEVHLFDGDVFSQHNAFRAPGAATIDELREHMTKVEYLARRYGAMHRGIVPHPEYIDAGNVGQLSTMDFVFIAIDANDAKEVIVDALESAGVPFIDVGIGIDIRDGDALAGQVRTTLSTPGRRAEARAHIPFAGGDANDLYSQNIQVADLNALSAVLAVIRWKRYVGFYDDLEGEFMSSYVIDGNHIVNVDPAA